MGWKWRMRLLRWRRHLLRWRTLGRAMLALLAAILIWTTLTDHGRTTAKAALFVPSLIPDSPVRPINWFTREPDRLEVTFSDGVETWVADLYLPGTKPPHPGIVVSLGVAPAPRDDRRVRRLADGLARSGIAALVPSNDTLRRKRVTPREVDFLVAAYQYLAARPEVKPERVGFLGVCVGASLALLAAQDARIAERVDHVAWFGGYYRLGELIANTQSRSYEHKGRIVPWQPDRLTREVVRLHLLEMIEDPAEREAARRVAEEGAALTQEERERLSPTASVVERLFGSPALAEARALVGQLPPNVQERLRRLSPATNVRASTARLYLMDDSSDRLIPFVHTRALARDLPGGYERHSKFSIFSHVDLDKIWNPAKSMPQLWQLFLHVDSVFQGAL